MISSNAIRRCCRKLLACLLGSYFLVGCPDSKPEAKYSSTNANADESVNANRMSLDGTWISSCKISAKENNKSSIDGAMAGKSTLEVAKTSEIPKFQQERLKIIGLHAVAESSLYSDPQCINLLRTAALDSTVNYEETIANGATEGQPKYLPVDLQFISLKIISFVDTLETANILNKYCDGEFQIASAFDTEQLQSCRFPHYEKIDAISKNETTPAASKNLYTIYQIEKNQLHIGMLDKGNIEKDGSMPGTRFVKLSNEGYTKVEQ